MPKTPGPKPSTRLFNATAVGYCPRCRAATNQQIRSLTAIATRVQTTVCEGCGMEIAITVSPKASPLKIPPRKS